MRGNVWSGKAVWTKPMTTSLLQVADNMVRQHSTGSHMHDSIKINFSCPNIFIGHHFYTKIVNVEICLARQGWT